jgi:outer membrane protein assembly factor BamD
MMYRKILNIALIGGMLASCAVHAQSDSHYLAKYQEAEALYERKNYYKALQLFNECLPLLKGKKEIIQAQLHQAYSYFYQKDYKSYKVSAKCFENFYKTYPKLPEAEEALYMQGCALYSIKSDPELDQVHAEEAVHIFNQYLVKYPVGNYREKAFKCINQLKDNLVYKAFFNAKLYYQLEHHQAAVVALSNFQRQYPAAQQNEEAAYIKIKAQDQLAKDTQSDIEQGSRLRSVIMYCYEFLDKYPNSLRVKEVQQIYEHTLAKIEQFSKIKTP